MIGSLYCGISGLSANATAMSVIGDNIANVNTIGFKSSRSLFANLLSTSLVGSTGNEIGRGTYFWGVNPSWIQGSFENTGSPTDLAINGKGLFVLQDDAGAQYYSRAGAFNFNENGDLVNLDGLVVQGYSIATDGTLGSLGNINVPGESTTPPGATTQFTVDVNLDSRVEVGTEYTTSFTAYDSLGSEIPITIKFTKTAADTWGWEATVPTEFVGAGNETVGSGSLTFNGDGSLQSGTDPTLSIALTNGATTPLDITWDLYNDNTGESNGDLTQYSSDCAFTFQTQDGYPSGTLRGISVDDAGVITGSYSNGRLVPIYQIALADFASYYGLTKIANNLYEESGASGQPVIGVPGTGTLGSISAGALEMSNVDLATEFVKMITTQRAFQANSKIITTSDELLSDLINIRR